MTVSANVSSILQQIAKLSAAERSELRARFEKPLTNGTQDASQAEPPTTPSLNPSGLADPKYEAAFKWINAHGSEYQGQWLALDGDRLLAHGANLTEVAAAARAAGVQFPLLHLVEPPREYPYIRS
ncbi:MAG: DUF5678 domain-containing protein [Acidobacteriota bacterium]